MTELSEKHYSIDPGKGKKMDGCPYSIYEDGHDVKEFIIPPKGFVFVGFQFDPNARNQIYDGKLTAEYTKVSFTQRFKDNLWKFVLAFAIIAVIALIVVLAAGVFKKSDSTPNTPKTSKNVVQPKDTVTEKEQTLKIDETSATNSSSASQVQEKVATLDSGKTNNSEEIITQRVADDPNTQFKQEFWALIHQGTFSMDSYHELFTNYKGKVEGEEYDYLKFTILKDYVSFKAWYDKLKKIPESQLQSIKSVDELKKRINE